MKHPQPKFSDLQLIREGIKAYEQWRKTHHKDGSTLWRDRVKKGLQAQGFPVKDAPASHTTHERPPEAPEIVQGDAFEG